MYECGVGEEPVREEEPVLEVEQGGYLGPSRRGKGGKKQGGVCEYDKHRILRF